MPHDVSTVLSSPDPLGMSQDNLPTPSPAKASYTTPRKALHDTNSNVRLQDFYLTTPPPPRDGVCSPSKSTAQIENLVSPWRIRVTVEAEREDEQDGISPSPTKRLTERTTTTTIPLKGADISSPAPTKKGRGRPRKSLGSPVKRNGTPKPKAAGRRKTMSVSLDNKEIDGATVVTPSKRGRGRPRKSIESRAITEQPAPEFAGEKEQVRTVTIADPERKAEQIAARPRSKGRRKAMTPIKFIINAEDGSVVGNDAVGSSDGDERILIDPDTIGQDFSSSRTYSELPSKKTMRTLKDSRYSALKIGSQRKEIASRSSGTLDIHNSQPQFEPVPSPSESPSEEDDEDIWRSMVRRDSQTPKIGDTPANYKLSSNEDQMDPHSEPTYQHREFDSILESEGFSMVSVSSLPSARHNYSSPTEALRESENSSLGMDGVLAKTSLQPSSVSISNTSAVHAGKPSSQNSSVSRNLCRGTEIQSSPPPFSTSFQSALPTKPKTPSILYSSPSLPPPLPSAQPRLSPRTLARPTDGTPKLVRVVRAGIALQGVLSPVNRGQRLGSPAALVQQSSPLKEKSPIERLDELFSGFGAGTRRELRAGLRLGEELAKRQQTIPERVSSTERSEDDVFHRTTTPSYPILPSAKPQDGYSLKLPESEQKDLYPVLTNRQLPSPARSETDVDDNHMSWKANTPVRTEATLPSVQDHDCQKNAAGNDSIIDETMLARKAEWQAEREAVSRQIQMASTSQVIVIDSDSEEYEEDEEEDLDGDIWQAEAHSSDAIQEPTIELPQASFQDEIIKPRRSKLPSPWRRQSQVVYSDEPAPNNSDLLWQPEMEVLKVPKTPGELESSRPKELDGFTVPDLTRLHVSNAGTKAPISPLLQCLKAISTPIGSSPEEQFAVEGNDSWETPSTDYNMAAANQLHESFEGLPEDRAELTVNTVTEDRSSLNELIQHSTKTVTNHRASLLVSKQAWLKPLKESDTLPTLPVSPPKPVATSWLTHLTSYIPLWRPSQTTTTIASPLCSGPTEYLDLSLYTPWDSNHYRALYPLYLAQSANPKTYPFNSRSPSTFLLGQTVSANVQGPGWAKKITRPDCAVIDHFMNVLRNRGFALRIGREEKLIDEMLVAVKLFNLWAEGVCAGECEVGPVGKVGVGRRRRGSWREDLRERRERDAKRKGARAERRIGDGV